MASKAERDIRNKEIYKAYRSGEKVSEIAARFDLEVTTVYIILRSLRSEDRRNPERLAKGAVTASPDFVPRPLFNEAVKKIEELESRLESGKLALTQKAKLNEEQAQSAERFEFGVWALYAVFAVVLSIPALVALFGLSK